MIDLDAAREARAAENETKKKAPELKLAGKSYEMPVELPLNVVLSLQKLRKATVAKDGDLIIESLAEGMGALLGDQYGEFMNSGPSVNDLAAVLEGIPEEYGLGLGNSSASPKRSKSTTTRSKRASKPRTA